MAATDLAKKPESPVATIRGLLERSKDQVRAALPRHMSSDRLLRISMTSIQRNPRLLECTPTSLIGAIIEGAQLGLEPDGVRAYLIPRKNNKKGVYEAQFMPSYRGLLDLVSRSGRCRISPPVAVFAHDEFSYTLGLDPTLTHKRCEGDDHGELTHVYAVARYNDGSKDFRVMTRAEVEDHRGRSTARNEGPWQTDYDSMALKTVVRDLAKFVPSSPELQRAITLDEQAEIGVPQNLDIDLDVQEEAKKPALEVLGETMNAGAKSRSAIIIESLSKATDKQEIVTLMAASDEYIKGLPLREQTPIIEAKIKREDQLSGKLGI